MDDPVSGIFDPVCSMLRNDLKESKSKRIYLSFEAGHSDQIGRPGGLVLAELLREPMLVDRSGVEFQFIEDRTRIPSSLDGHVICIGGPRSNVLSRAALEYETSVTRQETFYRRISSPSLGHSIEYMSAGESRSEHTTNLNNSIFTDLVREFPDINLQDFQGSGWYAYTPASFFKSNDNEAPETAMRAVSMRQLNNNSQILEYVIHDYLILTIMLNVFSSYSDHKDFLFIYHGLRSLGTLAALREIRKGKHVTALEALMASMRSSPEPTVVQRLWTVGRKLPSRLDDGGYIELEARGPQDRQGESKLSRCSFGFPGQPAQFQTIAPRAAILQLRDEVAGRPAGSAAFRSQLVRVNQIDAEQVLGAMSLRRDELGRNDGTYVLGCFERTKTVYTQQARAFTLIHALHKAGRINPGTTITIVGGGAGGIAAAIAAVKSGVRVNLLERSDQLMPIQRDASHRHIHPFFYDWPYLIDHEPRSDLRWLEWTASSAAQVRDQIIQSFKTVSESVLARYADQKMLTVHKNYDVKSYFYDVRSRRHCVSNIDTLYIEEKHNETNPNNMIKVDAKFHANLFRRAIDLSTRGEDASEITRVMRYPHVIDSDVLIFSTGFGEEKTTLDGNIDTSNLSYWQDDSKKFDDILAEVETDGGSGPHEVLVSGGGDGALIDILRLCIRNFDHAAIVKRFCELAEVERHRTVIAADARDRFDDINILAPGASKKRSDEDPGLAKRICGAGEALKSVFGSTSFRFNETEGERIEAIQIALHTFQIDNIFEDLGLKLNNIIVHNVDLNPQPFSSESAVAHRLLVFALLHEVKSGFIEDR